MTTMPSRFPYHDPITHKALAPEIVLPPTHKVQAGAFEALKGIFVLEEHQFMEAWDTPLFALPGPRLHIPLNIWSDVGCNIHGRWQSGVHTPGDVMITPAQTPTAHCWSGTDKQVLHIMLEPHFLFRIASEFSYRGTLELRPEFATRDERLVRLGLLLRDEILGGGLNGRLFSESLATALSIRLLNEYGTHPCGFFVTGEQLGRQEVRRAIEFIHDNLSEDIGLAEIATATGLSISRLTQLFRKATGYSIHAYTLFARVEKAKELLRYTHDSVSAIAQTVGFYDQAHFIRHFKKSTHLTPTQYRSRSR